MEFRRLELCNYHSTVEDLSKLYNTFGDKVLLLDIQFLLVYWSSNDRKYTGLKIKIEMLLVRLTDAVTF